MTDLVKPSRALLSVSDKTGLIPLAEKLSALGVELISTGGTARSLRDAGLIVRDVSDVTGFPEIMDGRVKTLHPNVHGGLLARRDLAAHVEAMKTHGIEGIDLLVVNLYPFQATVASGAGIEDCIENIDIGGPAMIRAAAKNHGFVTVVTDPAQYAALEAALDANDGATTHKLRQEFARDAYAHTAGYDAAISNWMSDALELADPARRSFAGVKAADLRYGENPHQKAAFFSDQSGAICVAQATQHQGKELSYNNINDTDAAFALVSEFDPKDGPACAIIKHANPCGVARGSDLAAAYKSAFECDQTSAFGGIVAFNQALDVETAKAVTQIFTEVVIAPEVSDEAKAIFAQKPNLRLLETGALIDVSRAHDTIRQVSGGYLLQDADTHILRPSDLKVVTERAPSAAEMADLMFAWTVAKHVKSNAIIYAKDGATVGVGAGQMSRIDSTRIAAWKARDAAEALGLESPRTQGSVVASDAFFPFADGLLSAAEAGATAIIQPGGAMRDADVIEAANEKGLAMVFTGIRHFRH